MQTTAMTPPKIHIFTDLDLEAYSQYLIKKTLDTYQLSTATTAPQQGDEVLTIKEAETVTKYKAGTLRQLAQQNKIPHHRPNGKNLIFFKSELMEWLRSNSNNPTKIN